MGKQSGRAPMSWSSTCSHNDCLNEVFSVDFSALLINGGIVSVIAGGSLVFNKSPRM